MSAWLCSEEHINIIVNAIGGGATNFKMLVKANLTSLEARYPGRDFLKEWQKEAKAYRFKKAAPGDMTQVVKSCDSFDYQACESDDYDDNNLAKVFVDMARKAAILSGGKSEGPEYDRADWSL